MESSLEAIPSWQTWALVFLLFGSFFFAGSETALTSLGEAKARQLRERLGRRGRVLGLWIDHPKEVLTCLLIGNNLVNIAASALATNISLILFGSAALAIATGGMTLLVLIFGEITPKTLAREHAEKVSVPILYLLRPFYLLSFPAVWLLSKLTGMISRLFGGEQRPPPVTSEDIDYFIDLGSRFGTLEGVKRELLVRVLEFSELLAKEIMNPRTQLVTLEISSSYEEVISLMEESEHSRIPVFEQGIDNVVGILYIKDILGEMGHGQLGPSSFELRRYLRPAFFVPEVMKVSRLLKEMQRLQTHIAVVVDEFGGTSGIVTLEDIVEEIVGDIRDEHDVEQEAVRRLPDGKILVDAPVPLREIEEVLDIEFPAEGDYETLGGFLTATARRVPPVGSVVLFAGYTFLIRASDEKKVQTVEISPRQTGKEIGGGQRLHGDPDMKEGAHPPYRSRDGDEHPRDQGMRHPDASDKDFPHEEPRFFLGPAS